MLSTMSKDDSKGNTMSARFKFRKSHPYLHSFRLTIDTDHLTHEPEWTEYAGYYIPQSIMEQYYWYADAGNYLIFLDALFWDGKDNSCNWIEHIECFCPPIDTLEYMIKRVNFFTRNFHMNRNRIDCWYIVTYEMHPQLGFGINKDTKAFQWHDFHITPWKQEIHEYIECIKRDNEGLFLRAYFVDSNDIYSRTVVDIPPEEVQKHSVEEIARRLQWYTEHFA